MTVHFLSNELAKWDDAKADALVLTVFADEKPLRGAAGLADWRLCGRISKLLKERLLAGDCAETLLMPTGRRLPFPRIILFGLGESSQFTEKAFRDCVRRIRRVCNKANFSSYAVQPPGRATGLIAARRALELWMEESESDEFDDEVAIVDTAGAQKEMADILQAYRRRAALARGRTS